MASGTIVQAGFTDGANYVKFSNGIMIAFGSATISASLSSTTSTFQYRGAVDYSLADLGFVTILTAFAGSSQAAAAWTNSGVTTIDNDNKTIHVTLGEASQGVRNAYWFAIGLWEE